MKVINLNTQATLADNVSVARSFMDNTIGLLKESAPTSLMLTTRFGIHTAGMRFAIDCVVLDNHNIICAMRKDMRPNDFFFWNPRYSKVIEFPTGTLEKTHTELGHLLAFE
jgi:uncharacterized membrane protein (UPF0127 family)